MKAKELFHKVFDTLFSHDFFRIVVLVMVSLRTCAFLSPIIGPFVKFTIVWAVFILIKDLFTERLFLVNRYKLILYLFLIAYGITCLIHREENFARNLAMLGYLMVNMLVMYAYEPKKLAGQVKKDLLRFSHTFLIVSFIGQFISLVTFVLNINFAFMYDETIYYYGVYDGRLWGFFTNPNAASFYAVLCFMLTVLCMLIQKGNIPRRWKIFYWANMVAELLVFFLCNSRTSILGACAFMVLLPVLLTIPSIAKVWENKKERRVKIQKLAAIVIVTPLALLGAHEYAIDILPHFVIESSAISDQLTESLESYAGANGAISSIEGSEDLERGDYGSKFGGRYYLWQSGVEIIKNDPLFGVANDNVPNFAYRYAARYFTNFGADVYLPGVTGGLHNLFFQIGAASGLVGLGIFLIFGALLLIRFIRYYIWMVREDRLNRVAVACFCIVAVILLRTMTDTGIIYGLYYLGVIFWTALSALMYFMDTEYQTDRKPLGARIESALFHRGKDTGIPKIKPLSGGRKIRWKKPKVQSSKTKQSAPSAGIGN